VGGVAGGYALQYLGGQQTFVLAAVFPLIGLAVIAFGLNLSHQLPTQQGMFK
jgi:PPP family 3-phenylpropionic acid transporter